MILLMSTFSHLFQFPNWVFDHFNLLVVESNKKAFLTLKEKKRGLRKKQGEQKEPNRKKLNIYAWLV